MRRNRIGGAMDVRKLHGWHMDVRKLYVRNHVHGSDLPRRHAHIMSDTVIRLCDPQGLIVEASS
jgi:hypothetical protein